MSKQLEGKFATRLIDWFNSSGGYARKIHGNVYQSGIPDVLIVNKNGLTFLAELKMWRRVNNPVSVKQITGLLGRQQGAYIRRAWELGAFLPVLTMHESGQIMYYCDGTNLTAHIPQQLVSWLLNLKYEDLT